MASAKQRILVTGGGGFVAPYVFAALRTTLADVDLVTTVRATSEAGAVPSDVARRVMDITDAAATATVIADFQPTHVIHLAGIAAPTKAGADPDLAWRVNLGGTLNVARAILAGAKSATLIFAGSGLVYGDLARSGVPLNETDLLLPNSDYAATKAAADLALGALVSQGLKVIRCRPFNHTGPGQTEDFVLPSFAAQIARIERGDQPPVIEVGNLDAERDFLDVRDVADAYVRCVQRSQELTSGVVFNIASGVPVSIRALLEQLLSLARMPIKVQIDPKRWRPNDLPRIVGNASAAARLLGWSPKYNSSTLAESLLNASRRG